MSKILLIDPPTTRSLDFGSDKLRVGAVPPLGLAYIAAVLEQKKHEVKILDCTAEGILDGEKKIGNKLRYGLSDEEIKKFISKFNPDVAGISCLFSNKHFDTQNVARIVKEVSKDIVTIAGGMHPTVAPEMTLEDGYVDIVVLGEGEYTFRNLVNALKKKKDISRVDGIAFKRNEKIIKIPKKTYIENLDELPLPARHLLKMDIYSKIASPHSGLKRTPFTSMITSRGCPIGCTFCSLRECWGNRFRPRSPDKVLEEIEILIRDYEIKEIHFEDDNLTLDRKRAEKIFDGIIRRNLDITWNVPSGLSVFALDGNLLEKMKESGCYEISIAIESGDQWVLNTLMRKPVDLTKVKPIVDKGRSLGFKVKGFFIIGLPGETKEHIERTVKFAAETGLDWAHFFIATPHLGTDLYRLCKEKGYIGKLDMEKSFFRGIITTPEFNPEYLEKVKERANYDINFRNNVNMKEGKYDRAIEHFKSVVDLYPKLTFARFFLAEAYFKKGDKKNAIKEFEKVVELDPQNKEAQERIKELR
ncbi:MAG: cobalamin-dependent protein [Candidatus Aenigmarchaeota archaeon]|nr:cobalamin-dependent protein [Candidatus Aenigmarchaeota archaeon]